ncbi:MAG: hemerythrin domain-containing protein [Candidatus Omnitrophota bacterium]
MMPVGPLMIEHRLIERMIKQLKEKSQIFQKKNEVDILFIDKAVDFIRVYADRCHHGKEEDILFRDLAKKNLYPEHKNIMDELVKEHAYARNITKSLVSAKEKYSQQVKTALSDIVKLMADLVEFYPKHIEKEDKYFFLPCMKYFSKQEQAAMLNEFWEFDKKLVHEKYKKIVEEIERVI